jgi:hypothetical protein
MKNTLKTILAALSLSVAIAACTSKPAETTTETTPADTTATAPVVEADTTTVPADTVAH